MNRLVSGEQSNSVHNAQCEIVNRNAHKASAIKTLKIQNCNCIVKKTEMKTFFLYFCFEMSVFFYVERQM